MQDYISYLAKIKNRCLYKIILIERLFQDISNRYFTWIGSVNEADEK